jgi:hypothetical protein
MSTYLELVNLAISEAGKDQDDLTSGNFASPPDVRLYNRFKRWVNEGYKEVQMARNEWEFKTGRASVLISPAIYIEEGDRALAPPVGTLFRGQDSGFELEVQQVILESGTWLAGTAKATIYFFIPDTNEGTDFKFNELFDEIDANGAVLTAGVLRCKGWGRYDFVADGSVTDFLELIKESAYIQSTGGSAIQDNESDVGLTKLIYIDWNDWQRALDGWAGGRSEPYYITTSPDGDLELYPRPDKQYLLYINYTKTDGTMAAHGDTPANLPSRYHEICAWIAVRKSGMYDRDRAIVSRANELINQYRNSMERNLMPDVSFGLSRFNNE